jgi:hypothetical protein
MKNIQLSLKTKWFELTDTDGKTEDYREINEYWWKRLVQCGECYRNLSDSLNGILAPSNEWKMIMPKKFTHNIMTLGYPKSTDISRIKIFEHAGIEIGYGKEEWGAEPNKLYFIIKHGKRIQ